MLGVSSAAYGGGTGSDPLSGGSGGGASGVLLCQEPSAVLGRFLDKQRREEQFSEDMRKVVFGGSVSSGRGMRNSSGSAEPPRRARSPGLLAAGGAVLSPGCSGQSAAEANAESHAACRQAVENARRRTSPFDDHRAFGASSADRERPSRLGTPPQPMEGRAATQASTSLGKQNRDVAQKIGAPAPYDAPFDVAFERPSLHAPAGASADGSVAQALPREGVPSREELFAEAQAEAGRNKGRMRGCQDLIGGYLQSDSPAASQSRRGGGSLPPRPGAGGGGEPKLLPEAHIRLLNDGVSAKDLTMAKVEYLNSKVLAEATRERNTGKVVLG